MILEHVFLKLRHTMQLQWQYKSLVPNHRIKPVNPEALLKTVVTSHILIVSSVVCNHGSNFSHMLPVWQTEWAGTSRQDQWCGMHLWGGWTASEHGGNIVHSPCTISTFWKPSPLHLQHPLGHLLLSWLCIPKKTDVFNLFLCPARPMSSLCKLATVALSSNGSRHLLNCWSASFGKIPA